MTPDDFVQHYGPLSDDIAQQTGVHPDVPLAIAAQETGWGNHVSGNNIFGISPTDPSGQQYVEAYPSVPHAAQAFSNLIQKRYGLAREGQTPEDQAQLVTDLGYNTVDPGYASSLAGRMQQIRQARERQKSSWDSVGKPVQAPATADWDSVGTPVQAEPEGRPLTNKQAVAQLPVAKRDTPFVLPSAPAPQPDVDEYGRQIGKVDTTPSPALERIKEAASAGFTGAPSILPPAAQDWMEKHGLGRTTALDLPFQILSAGLSGGAQAAYETAKGVGMPEQLARDVAGYIEQGGSVTSGAPHVPLMEPLRLARENREAARAPAAQAGAAQAAEQPGATAQPVQPAVEPPTPQPPAPAAPARTMEQEALDELPPEWTKPGLREQSQASAQGAPSGEPIEPKGAQAPPLEAQVAPGEDGIPTVSVTPPRIRTLEQIQTEDSVGAKKAAAIQMEEIAAVGRPITTEEAAARKAGVTPAPQRGPLPEAQSLPAASANPAAEEAVGRIPEPPPPVTEDTEPQGPPVEPSGRATPYEPLPREPVRLIDYLRRPTVLNAGTIHETTIPGGLVDAGGDLKAILGGTKGRPGLISSKGRTLDDATLQAWQDGYFPEHGDQRPEINHLLDAISEDHNGVARYSDKDLDRVQEYQQALAQNSEIDRLADQHEIPTKGLNRDQFFDALHDRLSFEQRAAEIAEQDAAGLQAQRELEAQIGTQPRNEFYDQSQARTLEDLEREHQQEKAAPAQGEHAGSASEDRSSGRPAGAGEEGAGSHDSSAGPTGRGAAEGPQGDEALAQFARKPPLPQEGGAPLFGEAPPESKPKREPEPTIKTDKRQTDMFGTADAAVQTQAARDQAGRGALEPKGPQAKADEGLFAPKEPEQGGMFSQRGWDTAGGETDRPPLEKPAPEAVKALTDAANKMLGGKGTIEIYDAGENGFTIRGRDGTIFQASGYTLGRLIRVALGDTKGVLDHEVLHALRNMGLFTEGEWNRLLRAAEQGGWPDKTAIGMQPVREVYAHLPYEKMLEESIAEKFRQFMQSGGTPPLPLMARILTKIKAFMQRLRTGLAGEGFRTPEDVFGKIASGEIGGREIGSGMPARGPQGMPFTRQFANGMHADPIEDMAQFARRPQANLALPQQTSFDVVKEKKGLARWGAEIKAALSPTSLKGAKAMERDLRQHSGTSARDYDQAVHKLDQVRQAVDRLSQQDKIAFTHRIETLQPQPTPELQAAADALRSSLDDWATKIKGLGRGYLANAIDGYMGHIWGNYHEWIAGQQVGRTQGQMQAGATAGNVAKSPLRGPGHFLKQRSFPTQEEGIAQGLIPVTYNPIDLQLIKIHELQKFFNGTQLADRMKQNNIATWVREADQRDAESRGWVKLNDRVFQPKLYGASPIGPVEPGAYYANEAAARIFNNYMSVGWSGQSSIYDAVRQTNNALNNLQLGIPGFHATFVMMDTAISKAALGMEQIMAGHPVRGGGNVLFGAVPPAAVIATLRKGGQVRKAWLDPANAKPEMRQLADILQSGGQRISMPKFFQTSASGAFFKSLKDLSHPENIWNQSAQMFRDEPVMWRKAIMTPVHIAARLLDTINEPVMGALVPRAKLGVMADLVQNYLRDNPNASPEALRDATIKFSDSVDNRLGQLNYDNLHWNKVAKDIAFITTRSVGWNLGTMREIGGGMVDTAKALNDVAHMRAPQFTSRMAYTMVLPIITAEVGAMMTYLATGKPPQHRQDDILGGTVPLDYFYPPTGADEEGNATDRRSIPGYMKDVFAFYHDPIQTVLNKTSPLPEAIQELTRNRNFYGGPIYDPQTAQGPVQAYGDFLINQTMPFAFRAQAKLQEQGASKLDQSLAWFGFQPAPAFMAHPEKEAKYLQRQNVQARKAQAKAVNKGNVIQWFNKRPDADAHP